MWTSLLGRILARRWRLPGAQTREVICERDLRIEQEMIKRQLDLVRVLEPHVDRQVALGVKINQ